MKKVRILLWLLLIIFTFSSCSQNSNQSTGTAGKVITNDNTPITESSSSVGAASQSVISDASVGEYDGEIRIEENNKQTGVDRKETEVLFDGAFPGGVQFEKDNSVIASLQYNTESDKDQELALNTPDGVEWNLVIPSHALTEPTTITMTSLKKIESESLGSLAAGVLLEPDGLQFRKPVRLTMRGDSAGDAPILLYGDHKGSRIELAMVEKTDEGVSASLTHFSTAYGDSLDGEDKRAKVEDLTDKNYESLRQIALDCLKKPISVPAPPAMPLRCPADHEEQNESEFESFLYQFDYPERSIIEQLSAAAKTSALLKGGEAAEEARYLSARLAKRLVKKADKLYTTYYPREEYLKPVARAASHAAREFMVLGGAEETGFMEAIAGWINKVVDQYLEELREKHDYKLAKPAMMLGREAQIFNPGKDTSLQELQNAIQFEVQFEAELILGADAEKTTYKTSGKAPYTIAVYEAESIYSSGQGQYNSFTCPEPEVTLKLPNKFEFETAVDQFDPCFDKPFNIYIDRVGAKSETYLAGGYAAPGNAAVQPSIGLLLEKQISIQLEDRPGQTFFKFEVPLQNRNATAAEKTFRENNNGGVEAIVTIRLVHKPK